LSFAAFIGVSPALSNLMFVRFAFADTQFVLFSPPFFFVTFLVSLPGLAMLVGMRKLVAGLDIERENQYSSRLLRS
jgi:hypothetical protein